MILTDICTYIKAKTGISKIYEETFPSETECVMARGDPSGAKVDEYLDGTEAGEQLVTFHCRSASQTTAKNQLELIFRAVKNACMDITGYDMITCERVTSVSLINKTETKIYTFAFSARVIWNRSN